MLKYSIVTLAFGIAVASCSSSPSMTINEGPVVVTTTTSSAALSGGRAYWTTDALILELRMADTTCGASPPTPGDVVVSVTVPRALAVPGEIPITSDILNHGDVDVAVTELDDDLSSQAWLLGAGVLRLDAIGDTNVVGGLVAADSAGPGVNGVFSVAACGMP